MIESCLSNLSHGEVEKDGEKNIIEPYRCKIRINPELSKLLTLYDAYN